jgi:hypothetical protein
MPEHTSRTHLPPTLLEVKVEVEVEAMRGSARHLEAQRGKAQVASGINLMMLSRDNTRIARKI